MSRIQIPLGSIENNAGQLMDCMAIVVDGIFSKFHILSCDGCLELSEWFVDKDGLSNSSFINDISCRYDLLTKINHSIVGNLDIEFQDIIKLKNIGLKYSHVLSINEKLVGRKYFSLSMAPDQDVQAMVSEKMNQFPCPRRDDFKDHSLFRDAMNKYMLETTLVRKSVNRKSQKIDLQVTDTFPDSPSDFVSFTYNEKLALHSYRQRISAII